MPRDNERIVITGIGLAAPNGDCLAEYRKNLLAGVSGVREVELPYVGLVAAGICEFDQTRYRSKKENRRGTRAGCIGVYCAREALSDAGIESASFDPAATGVYIGLTEHGTVETEHEIHNLASYGNDLSFWSHHHNPRTVLNNPAGEITINLGITGPHYVIGGACAAGNLALIQGAQMLRLGEVDVALAGGVSESPRSFGIFASFRAQGALAGNLDPTAACRPFDRARNGIVVSEGGCVMVLETLARARKRKNARIYGEIVGYAVNSDARDFVLPFGERQAECMDRALNRAGLVPGDVDLLSSHATGTPQGDLEESRAIRQVFAETGVRVNNTKSLIGHTMGAAGALELAGNLPSFADGQVHPTINLDDPDPECHLAGMVASRAEAAPGISVILNNSFGMLGINSVVVVKKL